MGLAFNPENPVLTDPPLHDKYPNDYAWDKSLEPNVYYSWIQKIAPDITVNPKPLEIELGHGIILSVYYSWSKHELLYRIKFTLGLPHRIKIFPEPFCLFWSFGRQGGPSGVIKYHYRDKYLTLHEWVDKKSYLAVLRQQLYLHPETATFWSR